MATPAEQALRLMKPRKTDPDKIRILTEWFVALGEHIIKVSDGTPEQTIAIRKLVEAKQAAIVALGEDED